MSNVSKNTSIHHISLSQHTCMREHARGTDELMFCGISNPACWNCRYYVPENALVDLKADWPIESEPGTCHRCPPVSDHRLEDEGKYPWADYPIVMANDWCGEFAPRHVAQNVSCGDEQTNCD